MFAAPSIGLRPFIEQAFTREHVAIDFAGFSGETLHGAVQEPLDKIRIGLIKPETVTLRPLLPDTSRPMVLPCRADDLSDDPDYRVRAHQLTPGMPMRSSTPSKNSGDIRGGETHRV